MGHPSNPDSRRRSRRFVAGLYSHARVRVRCPLLPQPFTHADQLLHKPYTHPVGALVGDFVGASVGASVGGGAQHPKNVGMTGFSCGMCACGAGMTGFNCGVCACGAVTGGI